MRKKFYRILFFAVISLLLTDCARTGSPNGGPKDEKAPIMVTANPPYETTNFNKKNIRIYFDEYIVLKDLMKQLIVSPPLKNPPIITPQGTPSKYINIKLLDTLKANTTYTFNFGNAVQDNNENNKLENFKYVFSTGEYIDSLKFKGSVEDAFEQEKLKEVSVGLYRLDSTYNDSIIYKQKPNYVTSTLDSTYFQFSNLKEGKYLLTALKEDNKDYIFNPITDKVGFVLDTISLPRDSVLKNPIRLFKEEQPFKFKRGREASKGKIQFGFTGKRDGFKIALLSKVHNNFKSVSQFERNKDTLNYWFTPTTGLDSLTFSIAQNKFKDTIIVKLRKKKVDSLKIEPSVNGVLNPNDTLFIEANNPIFKTNSSKIRIVDKDTLDIKFRKFKSKTENKLALLFDRKFEQYYTITILPEAITDIFNQQNDSIFIKVNTEKADNYGKIELNVNNPNNRKLIIQLLSEKKILKNVLLNTSKKIDFNYLDPQKYTIRAIVDFDNNNKWSAGHFLSKFSPEKVIYLKNDIKLRPNWIVKEIFNIN